MYEYMHTRTITRQVHKIADLALLIPAAEYVDAPLGGRY